MTTNGRTPEAEALPELSDERIARIEDAVFSTIAREHRSSANADRARRRTRRRRAWWGAGVAASVVLVAAVIAPGVGSLVTGTSGGASSDSIGVAPEGIAVAPDSVEGWSADDAAGSAESADAPVEDLGATREVITRSSVVVEVDDAEQAAQNISDAATAAGGYVEGMSIGGAGSGFPSGAETGVSDTYPYPYPMSDTWITVRVPADRVDETVALLEEIGDVQATEVSRQDVTNEAVDLRARVEAAQASVDRLTQLVGEAATVADLIAAESALAERQAELESLQQQLELIERQVALTSLTVSLITPAEQVDADPAGFGDGFSAGWNGLIATLNGVVVALGFLLPWLVVIAAGWLLVWFVIRAVRGRRTRAETPARTEDGA